MLSKYKGELGLLFVTMLWGTGFVVTASALEQFAPFQLLTVRFTLSAIIMSAIFFKKIRTIDKTTVKYGMVLGFFLFVGFALQTVGLMFTTPAKNAFITSANVVVVPFIGAVVYRRKIDIYSVFGAFVALIGIGLLSLKLDAPVSVGDLLTLGGAVFFAMHIFFTSEYASRGADTGCIVVVQMAMVAALAFIAALAFGQTDFSRANTTGYLLLLYMAVFTTSLCFFLQTWFQRLTTETKAAVVMSTECVFGTLFSVLLRYEILTPRMVFGAALIFAGVLITEVKPSFGLLKSGNEKKNSIT